VREIEGPAASAIRYDFGHFRLRDAAYEATSLARRRLLHRRTADALRLDTGGAGRDDLARLVLIAGHERAAGRTAEAADAYREAAGRAEAVFANRDAIDHLEAALDLGQSRRRRTQGPDRKRCALAWASTRPRSVSSRLRRRSRAPASCPPSSSRWGAFTDGAAI